MAEIPELRRFARRATASITAAGERAAASEELYEHALSRYDDARGGGLDHAAAIAVVVAGLGDPSALSEDLGRAHRQPLTVAATVLLVAAGLVFAGGVIAMFWLLFSMEASALAILVALAVLVVAAIVGIALLTRRPS